MNTVDLLGYKYLNSCKYIKTKDIPYIPTFYFNIKTYRTEVAYSQTLSEPIFTQNSLKNSFFPVIGQLIIYLKILVVRTHIFLNKIVTNLANSCNKDLLL